MAQRYYLKQNMAFEISEEGNLGLAWGNSYYRLASGASCPILEVATFCIMRLSGRGKVVFLWDESNPAITVRMFAAGGHSRSSVIVEARREEQVVRMVLGTLGVADLLGILLSNISLPDVMAMESGIIVRGTDEGAVVDVRGHNITWSHGVIMRVRRALILALESQPSTKKPTKAEKDNEHVFYMDIPEAELRITRRRVLGTDTFSIAIHQQYFRATGNDLARLLAFLSAQPPRLENASEVLLQRVK